MKQILAGVGLFFLQIYLVFLGEPVFDKFLNPVLLLLVTAAIPVYLIWLYLQLSSETNYRKVQFRPWIRWIWGLGGLLSVLVIYKEIRKAFVRYSDPEKWSDVITLMRTMSERFFRGEYPYAPIDMVTYAVHPSYMPLHWLPIGLGPLLEIDIRWIGYIFFAIAVALYSWFLSAQSGSVERKIVALILPSLALWAFIMWGETDLMVTYEIVICAYYLVLTTGLIARRLWLVTLGIILCLLSRYTMLFWVPLFALLLLHEKGWKKSLLVWGTVAVSFILLYVVPFYSKEPAMFSRGLSYYMQATVAEWQGYGDPPVSWSHERGISFAPHMKALFSGEMARRVNYTLTVQGMVMLLMIAGGLLAYRRWRNRIDLYTFCLIALYCFMAGFFFFGPLTFRYYLFPFLIVSAVLCGKIVLYNIHIVEKSNTS